MASGDSFLNTLTIEGVCDRSCNLRKFKDPLVYVRLPSSFMKGALRKRKGPANPRRRDQSVPPVMGRRGLDLSPSFTRLGCGSNYNGAAAAACAGGGCGCARAQGVYRLSEPALRLLSDLWLPICFAVINAVCLAIEPATGALMMTSSTLLLQHLGVVGRGLTLVITLSAFASLLLLGSDLVYIMVVHVLYYCAVSMGKSNTEEYNRTKRPYRKKSGSHS